jgi:hypothetical protein
MTGDGTARELSSWVGDWVGATLDRATLTELGDRFQREGHALPEMDLTGGRVGPAVVLARSSPSP